MNFMAIDKNRATYKVAQQIIKKIEGGTILPGEKLPSEEKLAKMMEVSRGTIREALSSLSAHNIVFSKNGSGTYVSDIALSKNIIFKALAKSLNDFSPIDVLEARASIESKSAFLAALNGTNKDFFEIESALKEQIKCLENNENPRLADVQFHIQIAKATKNPILEEITRAIFDMINKEYWDKLMNDMFIIVNKSKTGKYYYINQHKKILQAIKKRDGILAQRLALEHIEQVKNDLYKLEEVNK